VNRKKLLTVLFVLAFALMLQSCKFLMDEFFTLGKANPDLERLAQRHAKQ